MEVTKDEILMAIPRSKNQIRSDFRDLHRVVSSHKMSPSELSLLKQEVHARIEKLGIKPPAASKKWRNG